MDENPYQSTQGKGSDTPTVRPWADPGVLASLVSVLLFGIGGAVLIFCGFVALILLTDMPMPAQFERLAPVLCPIGLGASLGMLWLGVLARRSSSAWRSMQGAENLDDPKRMQRLSSKPSRWSIRQHIVLTFVVEMTAFLVAIAFVARNCQRSWYFLLPAAISIGLIARTVTKRIPARCPKCGRKAFRVSVRPFTYFCGACKNTHKTQLRMKG
jgi:hypothetical protein